MYNTFIICFSLEIKEEMKEERDSSAHSSSALMMCSSSFFFIRASEPLFVLGTLSSLFYIL